MAGHIDLKSLFPRLYGLTTYTNISLLQMVSDRNGENRNFHFRRELFVWEVDQLNTFVNLLDSSSISLNIGEDPLPTFWLVSLDFLTGFKVLTFFLVIFYFFYIYFFYEKILKI